MTIWQNIKELFAPLNFSEPAEEEAFRKGEWLSKLGFLRMAAYASVVIWLAFAVFDGFMVPEKLWELLILRVVAAVLIFFCIRAAIRSHAYSELYLSLVSHIATAGLVVAVCLLNEDAAVFYFPAMLATMFVVPIIFRLSFETNVVNTAVSFLLYSPIPIVYKLDTAIFIGELLYIAAFGVFTLFCCRIYRRALRNDYLSKKAVAESRERIEALLAHSNDFVILIDEHNNIKYVSNSVEKISGYSVAEYPSVGLDLIHPEDMPRVKAVTKYALTNPGVPVPLEMRVRNFAGDYRTYSSVGTSYMEHPAIRGIVVNFHDITERKALEESLRITKDEAMLLARTDVMTGLNNRRAFIELFEASFNNARRYKRRLSLMIIDIDHFKPINDNYGHVFGDEVISATGEAMRSAIRDADMAGRLGGEEFAIAMPETGIEEAKILAERLRQKMSEIKVFFDNIEISFTVSVGVAELENSHTVYNLLLAAADKALYRAKENGRNRVEVAA
ncbi:MAG: sensor domain-containing diguanylate cyclase [Deltaproteobacteria bacterium]|nr:sensor domain-containing diguanylate cyclase [Deltaproteobacteria bacterium]